MGRLNIVLSDDVERKLRFAIIDAYGGKKGDLSAAIEVAIKDWLENNDRERKHK